MREGSLVGNAARVAREVRLRKYCTEMRPDGGEFGEVGEELRRQGKFWAGI